MNKEGLSFGQTTLIVIITFSVPFGLYYLFSEVDKPLSTVSTKLYIAATIGKYERLKQDEKCKSEFGKEFSSELGGNITVENIDGSYTVYCKSKTEKKDTKALYDVKSIIVSKGEIQSTSEEVIARFGDKSPKEIQIQINNMLSSDLEIKTSETKIESNTKSETSVRDFLDSICQTKFMTGSIEASVRREGPLGLGNITTIECIEGIKKEKDEIQKTYDKNGNYVHQFVELSDLDKTNLDNIKN